MVWTKRKECCTLPIIRQAPDPLYCWNRLAGYVFRSHVPYPGLTKPCQDLLGAVAEKMTKGFWICTYPSEYCKILPFFDQASQLRLESTLSLLFSIRMVFGDSAVGGLEILHTRKSPSEVWVANMSDFCLVDDACHARLAMDDGARGVVSVCKIVKAG